MLPCRFLAGLSGLALSLAAPWSPVAAALIVGAAEAVSQ
jgi:hypothetical protein